MAFPFDRVGLGCIATGHAQGGMITMKVVRKHSSFVNKNLYVFVFTDKNGDEHGHVFIVYEMKTNKT